MTAFRSRADDLEPRRRERRVTYVGPGCDRRWRRAASGPPVDIGMAGGDPLRVVVYGMRQWTLAPPKKNCPSIDLRLHGKPRNQRSARIGPYGKGEDDLGPTPHSRGLTNAVPHTDARSSQITPFRSVIAKAPFGLMIA